VDDDPGGGPEGLVTGTPAPPLDDDALVTAMLGREPQGAYDVVVRRPSGAPVVIRNEPLLHDGTPMPTRFWLVDPGLRTRVAHLEAAGGVREADQAVDPDELVAAHEAYALERDAALPPDHVGPAPHGGIGGTRTGVKCLHAHLAYYLAGGDDPVGRWVAERLAPVPEAPDGPDDLDGPDGLLWSDDLDDLGGPIDAGGLGHPG
jgi:uncharacterized protein